MKGDNEGDDGPEGGGQQTISEAHGDDAEVGVEVREAEDGVAEEGDEN